jgi:hypothetical protein
MLLRLHVAPQHSVDGRLIALPALPKKTEDIGIEAERDLFLPSRPANGVPEKAGT